MDGQLTQHTKLEKGEIWGHQTHTPPYGLLEVSKEPPHSIYFQESGNPAGEPVFVIHGGPGGGCQTDYYKYFDPKRYRIIQFDQRGCGFSQPTVGTNPEAALKDNNTAELIGDIDKLRKAVGVTGKMHLFGGSWGSTLSLAYAIAHPENVKSLQLRGIFLGNKYGFDYIYQGNATSYDETKPAEAQDFSAPGTYRAYLGDGSLKGQIPPEFRNDGMAKAYAEGWHEFVTMIPKDERGDMVAAYSRILEHKPANEQEAAHQLKAAIAWSVWEGTTSYLNQDTSREALERYRDPEFAINFARIENRYFMHGCYLGMQQGEDPTAYYNRRQSNHIMDNLDKIKDIPMFIVHGKYDQVCPFDDAEELTDGLKKRGGTPMLFITNSGHSAMERDTAHALVKVTGLAPKMTRQEIGANASAQAVQMGR